MRRGAIFISAALGTVLLVASTGPAIGATGQPTATSGASAVAACRSLVAALPPLPDPPDPGLPVSQPVSQLGTRSCKAAESVIRGTAAGCRLALREAAASTSGCSPIDGRDISAAAMAAYQSSWVHQALALQRGLDANAPLVEEQIPHTHNSYNASPYFLPLNGTAPSYYPTLTNQDPNQVYSLTDQLNMDIRFLELDLHWVPSPFGNASTGFKWVTLCHGDSSNPLGVHVGCTVDRPLQDGLAEIRRWMDHHPDQFVFVYFENQLANVPLAHEIAGQLIRQAWGDQVSKPNTRCADMPLTTSRAAMQAKGAHLLIVGNCDARNGQATQWGTLVHSRGPLWNEGGDASAYDAAACRADSIARSTDANFRRMFGDDTFVTAVTGRDQNITAPSTAAMVACGVNIIGFDQLMPQDGRLAALVWSWTPAEARHPSGPCAVQTGAGTSSPGRFAGAGCTEAHPFACLATDRSWRVTSAAGPWAGGAAACSAEFPGSTFSVPVNGYRDQLLRAANPGMAWINYRLVGGTWTPSPR